MNYTRLLAIAAGMLIAFPLQARELDSWNPTAAELPLLPPFCAAKISPDPEDDKPWFASLGGDFIHVHHYCRGLVMFPRGFASRTQRARHEAFKEAIHQFDYMIGHASSTFVLMPEIYVNRGKALKLLNRPGEAIIDLNKALELNREMIGAYTQLADIYEEQKNKPEALKYITEALKYMPGSEGLKKRYQRLGGKLPYPEPYTQLEAPAPSVEPVKPSSEPASSAPAGDGAAAAPAQPAADTFKPGNGKNPWCRFCPD